MASNIANTEKSEMLEIYDDAMNPIGLKTRKEVHENALLHRTVRLWTIQDGKIWFQRRAEDKKLFPGMLDQSATGHVDPGETAGAAVAREAGEEIGIEKDAKIEHVGDMPFGFGRPDGLFDNEYASVYLYRPIAQPSFKAGPEVSGFAAVKFEDYCRMARGSSVAIEYYGADEDGSLRRSGAGTCGPADFCCPNLDEFRMVESFLAHQKSRSAGAAERMRAMVAGEESERSPEDGGPSFV